MCVENGMKPFFTFAEVTMGFGFVVLVGFNVATLVSYRFIPLLVYWLVPMVSLLGTGIVYVTLRAAVQVHKRSKRLVKKILELSGSNKSRLTRKEERTVIPVAIWCGGLYPLKRGAEADYWYWVFYRTVDCLLLILLE